MVPSLHGSEKSEIDHSFGKGVDFAMRDTTYSLKADSRNYGIDLLRLYSMFLIVILHVCGHGGVLASAQGASWATAWLLEIGAYCSVNCFALISGFAAYSEEERPYAYRKFIPFWLRVFVYSFAITFAAQLIKPPLQWSALTRAALPVVHRQYWYVCAYTGVFFLIPFLNRLVRGCSKRDCAVLLFTIFVLFSLGSCYSDPFILQKGSSFAWLAILYLAGACLKKCGLPQALPHKIWLVLLAGVWGLTWLWKCWSPIVPNLMINYVSPAFLLLSICYVCFFSGLSIGPRLQKLVRFLSPAAFGVYLIHVHPIVYNGLIKDAFSGFASSGPLLLAGKVLAAALVIFIVCLAADRMLLYVFQWIRVDAAAGRIAEKLACLVHRVEKAVGEKRAA